jgi:hypothetical protein
MRKTTLVLVTAALALVSMPASFAQSKDPQLGTWKLNPQKSSSTNPAFRPQKVPAILKIDGVPNGHHFVSDFVDADGQKVHTEYTAKYDGKEYPRTITTAGKPVASTISIRPIDEYTYEYTFKAANGTSSTQHTLISRDGKTRTNTTNGTTPQGQKVTNITIYDKQ